MYHVYLREDNAFDTKKLIGEYNDIDKAYAKVDAELKNNKDIKYVIEETTGYVDNYGELIATVVEEN